MKNYFNYFKQLLLVALLGVATMPAWGFTSTAKYSIAKTSDTPNGAGKIYGYRGGGDATTFGSLPYLEGDKLKTGGLSWVAAETGMSLTEMTIKQSGGSGDNYNPNTDAGSRPDGYKVLDRATENGDNTVHALHMYFYAKPEPGYEYMGWYDDKGNAVTGSTDHYPYPNVSGNPKKNNSKTYTPSTWDNGDGSSLPASGPYSDFFYLRYVELLTKDAATANKTMYVKFQVIPRHFKFVGTGFDNVSYTAAGTNVGKTTVESGNITSNIALNITYNENKYNFVKWQWSLGPDGAKTDIATTASATYTFVVDRGYPTVNYSTNPHTYYSYTMVYIWPVLTEKVDAEATVKIGDANPVDYEHWADAFAAANAVEGSDPVILTLKKDISGITTVQEVDRNMTLDLNNHTITGSVNNMFTVSAGEFTLCDNNPSAAGKIVLNISGETTYAVTVNSGAKLIMQSGGVSATNTLESGTSRGVEIKSGGTLEMTGGNIYAQSAKNAYALINRGTATIDNGNIQSRAKGTSTKGTGVTSVAFYNVGTSATVNGGTFSAVADSTTSYGVQMNVASKTMTINNATVNATAGKSGACALRRDAGKILVKDGKYKGASVLNTAATSSIELQGGIYSTYTNVRQSCTTGYDCYELQPGTDWNDGYRFEVIAATANPRVCKVLEVGKATSYYTSLSDALAYANNNTGSVMSIIMIAFEHTLPAGNYTLPQRADLIVPYSVDQTGVTGGTPVRVTSYSTPSAFRTLTFASGVHLDAFGKIEAGGRQNVSGQGASGCGASSGAYGHIILNSGSSITLESTSTLYAWGFITGSGEIDARRGSKVHEPFQIYGWAGGTNVSGYYSKTFPITEYFIQNIEAPVKYHPGARLTTATGVYVSSSTIPTDEVNVIGVDGDVAMFLMANEDDSEDTWVRKRYDASTDQQVFEVNSSARLGSLQITFENVPLMGTMDIDSRKYNLPLTHNMKIHLLTGSMGITQSTILLPGTEMEVDKEATLAINSGQNLYIFDDAQWGNKVFDGVPAHRIKYRPVKTPDNTIRDISSAAALGDAKLFVHGTFDVQGKLYTTSGGANIYSTNEDAGTIKFTSAAATSNGSVTIYSGTGSSTESVSMVPALLRNKDNSTKSTSGTAAGKSFAYTDNKWECWTQDGCFYVDNTNTYYAKPADYVALLNGKTENADHTYTSADNTRTLILVEGCQWWEVELEDAEKGLWHCTHPLNDVYYYYNGSAWEVKKQTVVWKNYDGTTVATYTNVPYKTTPVYNSTTPSRPMDAYYTYDFDGWDPALGPVTTDMVYTAKYVSKDRKYTIVFKNEDGSTIETNYCTMGQVPVCTKEPSREGYNLVWSPTIQAVTGDAEYQATFTNVVAASYLITFKNYNNTETLQSGQVTTGTMPVYSGATPTKPSTEDQQFTFTGWEPALHEVDADAIYTPTFSASAITYDIQWQVNGVIAKQETVNKGVTPSYGSIPTKEGTAQYSYAFTGWSPAVAPASKDETYVAQFSSTVNTYTITWSIDGVETEDVLAYGATPSHANPTKDPTVDKTFSFTGWSPTIASVTGNATYTAQFSESPRSYTITWLNDDNSQIDQTTVQYGVVPTHANPSKAATAEWTYTFAGWDNTPVAVTGDATYKATFIATKNQYTLNIGVNEAGYGSVDHASVTVPYGSTITKNGNSFTVNGITVTATPTTSTAQYNYALDHWNNLPDVVSGNVADVQAVFARTTRSYSITWKNYDGTTLRTDPVAYGETPAYGSTPTYGPTVGEVFTFQAWTPEIVSVTGEAIYTAVYTTVVRTYPVRWKNYDGTVLKESTHNYAQDDVPAADTYDGATPERPAQGGKNYTFIGWSNPVSEVPGGDVTYTAQYSFDLNVTEDSSVKIVEDETATTVTVGGENSKLTIGENDDDVSLNTNVTIVEDGGELVVSNGSSIGEENPSEESVIVVESGGQLNVENGGSIAADVFIIQATTEDQEVAPEVTTEVQVSGELSETGSKNVTAIYYDLTRKHGTENFLARVWYAVAVPWAVETPNYSNGGVFIKRGEEFIPQRLGATFDLLSYDGACRATNGASANCWVYLEDEIVGGADAVMVPGKLYMIYLTEETSTIRFKKADDDSPIHTNSLTISAHNETSNANDANWNGLANPATYKAYMNVSVQGLVQKFVPGTQPRDGGSYLTTTLDDKQAVGQPFFVQVDPSVGTEASVVVTRNNTPTLAPRRTQAAEAEAARYAIGIAANGKLADRLYIQTAEEKEDEYVIGKDMSKMGVSSYVAQMWVARYDSKLCLNTTTLINNKANYPLTISAPKAGEYNIFLNGEVKEGTTLYLTYDGKAIWNLTYGSYTATLEKGLDTHYGLRVVINRMPTGIEETTIQNGDPIRKVIVDEKVYIIRNGEIYSVTGQIAK